MLRRLVVFTLCVSNFLLASAEFVPLQERAEGRSLTGANLQNDSLYSNPAGGAFQSVYALDATYILKSGFAASILDTRTSSMGGALGYFRMPVEGTDVPTQGAKASLFTKYSESVAMGVSGKMLWSPSLTETGPDRSRQTLNDLDFGLLSNFGTIQFGTAIKNILGGNEALDARREMALGGRINWNQLLFFSLTVTSNISEIKPYQYGVGAEFMTPYYFSIKGGYFYKTLSELNQSTWSLGASFISPKFNVHYALEMPQYLNGKSEHILGLTVFL